MRLTRSLSAFALAGGLFASTAVLAAPEAYKVDPTHSFVTFSISHLGYSFLQGRFNDVTGSFTYDPDKSSANAIAVDVKTASVDTNHAERDKHLRSKDFLDTDKYPAASFKSTGFEAKDDSGVLTGDLTLHGVTKPIKVDVTFVGAGKDPWGGYRRGYTGKTLIKRADWGMDYNLGPAAETMELQFVIEGVRQ
jgi:polyisoprenoid-binding protein YceI